MMPNASFLYDGVPVLLEPSTMIRESEDHYIHSLPDGLQAIYEVTPISSDDPEEMKGFLTLLRFRNLGNRNSGRISQAKTADISLKREGTSPVLFHGLAGDSCGAQSFLPLDFSISGKYHMEPSGGRSSNTTAFPFFDITLGIKSCLFAIGWTGQWCADLMADDEKIRIQIGMCDSDFYLYPGESVRLPSVLFISGGDPAALRRNFRKKARELLSP